MAGPSEPFPSANRKVGIQPFEREPSNWRLLPRWFELESAPITALPRMLMTHRARDQDDDSTSPDRGSGCARPRPRGLPSCLTDAGSPPTGNRPMHSIMPPRQTKRRFLR